MYPFLLQCLGLCCEQTWNLNQFQKLPSVVFDKIEDSLFIKNSCEIVSPHLWPYPDPEQIWTFSKWGFSLIWHILPLWFLRIFFLRMFLYIILYIVPLWCPSLASDATAWTNSNLHYMESFTHYKFCLQCLSSSWEDF